MHGLYDEEGLFVPLSHFISSLGEGGEGDTEAKAAPSLSILPQGSAPPPRKKGALDDPYVIVGEEEENGGGRDAYEVVEDKTRLRS